MSPFGAGWACTVACFMAAAPAQDHLHKALALSEQAVQIMGEGKASAVLECQCSTGLLVR